MADRYRSLADRLIEEAMESGEFDDLDGAGRPIDDLEEVYDPDWWVKAWLRRNGAIFPPKQNQGPSE